MTNRVPINVKIDHPYRSQRRACLAAFHSQLLLDSGFRKIRGITKERMANGETLRVRIKETRLRSTLRVLNSIEGMTASRVEVYA
jgi:hypothetical protein